MTTGRINQVTDSNASERIMKRSLPKQTRCLLLIVNAVLIASTSKSCDARLPLLATP